VLGVKREDKVSEQELLRRTGQMPVIDCAKRATMVLAWGALHEGHQSNAIEQRIDWGQSTRPTRQSDNRKIPPQIVSDSLISRITVVWNSLGEQIKCESDRDKAKKMIRDIFK